MIWFVGPALLAVAGLTGPALLSLVLVCAVRLTRSLGVGATAYVVAFMAVGVLVS